MTKKEQSIPYLEDDPQFKMNMQMILMHTEMDGTESLSMFYKEGKPTAGYRYYFSERDKIHRQEIIGGTLYGTFVESMRGMLRGEDREGLTSIVIVCRTRIFQIGIVRYYNTGRYNLIKQVTA